MITIVYNETGHDMLLRAEGHAGYAPKGQDIVCAAVSTLMQTLAYSVDGGTVETGGGVNALTVQAAQSSDNMAKFELVTDGLMLLAQQYPANVQFVNLHAADTDNMDLQLFAKDELLQPPAGGSSLGEGARAGRLNRQLLGLRPAGCKAHQRAEADAGSRNPLGALDLQRFADGAAAGGAAGDGGAGTDGTAEPAGVQAPELRPAQQRLAKRSRAGHAAKTADAGEVQGEKLPQPPAGGSAPEGEANQSADDGEQGQSEGGTGEEKQNTEERAPLTAQQRRSAFAQAMQQYPEEFEEAMQRAAQMAVQNIRQNPQLNELGQALADAYGVDMSDMAGLIDAVKNGRVKNDEYYETMAQQRGISVKTARELDRMEGELQRANAEKQQAQQMRLAAEHQQRAAAVRAQWEAEAAKLKNSYPDFELDEVLNNPAVADMIRRGVGLEAAYRAAYFDQLMENRTALTAKQVEQGVAARIQQRASRPAENGTHPGGAAEMKVEVAHMTKQQREELARRARRGERIVL